MSLVRLRQGETDGMQEDSASTYLERFKAFVDDVRGLGYPKVSFFTVAVTGTTVRLPFLSKVRTSFSIQASVLATSPSRIALLKLCALFNLDICAS